MVLGKVSFLPLESRNDQASILNGPDHAGESCGCTNVAGYHYRRTWLYSIIPMLGLRVEFGRCIAHTDG